MEPFPLRTPRLRLDQPGPEDVDTIVSACTDPVFERFMLTPWPYERRHAEGFVAEYVPTGWREDTEWTWAIRAGEPLLGVVGVRLATGMVGYWLHPDARGRGVMTEALGAAIDAVFARTALGRVRWECRPDNDASRRVAEKTGFTMTGLREGLLPARDGGPAPALTGQLVRPAPAQDLT